MAASTASLIARLPPEQRLRFLQMMTPEQQEALRYCWEFWARPEQLPPETNPKHPSGHWRIWLLLPGRGFGKLAALDTPIPTPTGWTTMGTVKIGDMVLDERGRPTRVVGVSPVQFDTTYRVRFSDGSSLVAGASHQWATWDAAARKAFSRSRHEDRSRFPDDWPTWRVKWRKGGNILHRDTVQCAEDMIDAGVSIRAAARAVGRCRIALARHIAAGGFRDLVTREQPAGAGGRVVTTQQIKDTLRAGKRGDMNHCIPNARPLELPPADLPIPPYVLGAWLGDGTAGSGEISAHQDDQRHIRAEIESHGFTTRAHQDPQSFGILGLVPRLRALGVLDAKAVPAPYLRGSISQRLALLRGLMDTDGGVENTSTVAFVNTVEQIARAVYELVVSLGMRAGWSSRIPTLNGKPYREAFKVTFTPTMQVFTLLRKARRLKFGGAQQIRRHHRMIVAVEQIRPVAMRCISVDSPNHLYLMGRQMVPTHNTLAGAQWVRSEIESGRRRSIGLVGPTEDDVRKTMIEGPTGIMKVCPPTFLPVFEPSNRRLVWPNGGVAHMFSAEKPSALRGPNLDGAWCVAKGSLVATRRGAIPIEDVRPHDLVLTRVGYRPVVAATMTMPAAHVLRLEAGAMSLLATGNHRIWVEDRGFVQLSEIKPGDRVLACSGIQPEWRLIEVTRISVEDQPFPVYDLAVEGAHEFFANGILVHNCDEMGAWGGGSEESDGAERHGSNRRAKHAFDNLQFTLRQKPPGALPVRLVITTTPAPMPLLREIMNDPLTVVTRGTIFDNAENLDPGALEAYLKQYGGTRKGRQELYGEMLDSFDGALWSPDVLDRHRRGEQQGWRLVRGGNSGQLHMVGPNGALVYFRRIVISIDPAGSAGRKSNETGLVACGLGSDEHGYLLEDRSGVYSPERWAATAVDMYERWQADKIVAEGNFGGDMVRATLRAVNPAIPVKIVTASRGKAVRAEPISTFYESGSIHHVEQFKDLEDQLVTWDPLGRGDSPDRLDALVWGFTELMSRKSNLNLGHRGFAPAVIPIYRR